MRQRTAPPNDLHALPRRAMLIAATGLLSVPAAGCEEAAGPNLEDGTFYGEAVQLGNGTARSYVVLEDGAPVELGAALSEAALSGLPTAEGHTEGDEHLHIFAHLLPLPAENPTPFELLELDWNPAGHEPPGIYDVPHFDFHFYTISEAERNAIDPSDPNFQAKAERFPAPEFIPAGYITPQPVMAVPRMGVHWIDPTSPEFNGQPFTQTFIYGTWDGRVIFAEPMITKAFLESRPDVETPVGIAQRHDPPGFHPSAYRVYWDAGAGEYRVALTGFAERP